MSDMIKFDSMDDARAFTLGINAIIAAAVADERVAVVAWLRAEVASATLYRVDDVSVDAASAGVAMLLAHVANVIESGKHRREERA